jgi:hypothetical protein
MSAREDTMISIFRAGILMTIKNLSTVDLQGARNLGPRNFRPALWARTEIPKKIRPGPKIRRKSGPGRN